jgi:hypothetical protein
VGDRILFASVASYHCKEGSFATPVFPIDPSGHSRYIWHAIGQPALLSFFNYNCTNFGNYFALTLIVVFTFFVSCLFARKVAGFAGSAIFALIVFALQAKLAFRPETTAILVSLCAEHYRQRGVAAVWVQMALLLAWVQPTVFIIYGVYILCENSNRQWRGLREGYVSWLPVAILVNGVIAYFYPFDFADLIEGLVLNGRMQLERNDANLASIGNYYLRSDFFPLFGLAFFAVYAFRAHRNRRLLLMIPVVWYFGLRVPPSYYNIVPLFVVLVYGLMASEDSFEGALVPCQPGSVASMATVGFAGVLGFLGVLQGDLRDVNSFVRYRSTFDRSFELYQAIEKEGAIPCKVPSFFTLFLPSSFFYPSYEAKSKLCDSKVSGHKRVDIFAASGTGGMLPGSTCKPWPLDRGANYLSAAFKSDSGYSFFVCDR